MKFTDLVNKKLKSLHEQVPGEMAPAPFDPASMPSAVPAAPVPTPEPVETQKPLSPEGEVFLVRLLRKALFMNPGDIDEKVLKDLPEINETNAADVLTQIINIMKKYSSSIDIES